MTAVGGNTIRFGNGSFITVSGVTSYRVTVVPEQLWDPCVRRGNTMWGVRMAEGL